MVNDVIANTYKSLIDLVDTEMNIAMCKSDVSDFEIHPAIGFGIAIVRDANIVSHPNMIILDIPTVIEDYGQADAVTINVMSMYEEFRKTMGSKIVTYFSKYNVNCSSCEIGQFTPNYAITDPSIRGLNGSVTLTIEL